MICYFVRLIINCAILINVVPLAIKWRKEKKILKQLESLASRLQLTATSPPTNIIGTNGTIQRIPNGTKDVESDSSIQGGEKCIGGLDNHGYFYGSQNEFDASIFGMNPSQYIGPPIQPNTIGKIAYLI